MARRRRLWRSPTWLNQAFALEQLAAGSAAAPVRRRLSASRAVFAILVTPAQSHDLGCRLLLMAPWWARARTLFKPLARSVTSSICSRLPLAERTARSRARALNHRSFMHSRFPSIAVLPAHIFSTCYPCPQISVTNVADTPVTGHWSLVTGHWSRGHWSLVTGHASRELL